MLYMYLYSYTSLGSKPVASAIARSSGTAPAPLAPCTNQQRFRIYGLGGGFTRSLLRPCPIPGPHGRNFDPGERLLWVPREHLLKGHLPRVMYHRVQFRGWDLDKRVVSRRRGVHVHDDGARHLAHSTQAAHHALEHCLLVSCEG